MALWVRRREVAVSLRRWSALAIAMSTGVTVAIAISMIERSDQPHDYGLRMAGIATVLCVGAWSAPWQSLSYNLVTKRLRLRRVSLLGIRTLDASPQDVTRISLSARPCLRYWKRYHLQLRMHDGTWMLPLGWSWRETSERRLVEAIQPWIADLRRTAPAIQVDVPRLERSKPQLQLSLRRLLLMIFVVAAAIAAVNAVPWSYSKVRAPFLMLASFAAIGGAFFYRPGSETTERFLLAPIAMYFPMLWIIAENQPFGRKVGIYEEAILYPAIWVSFLPPVQILPDGIPWSATFVILAELAFSLIIAQRGWRWTMPWVILLLAISTFGALVLRAFALE